MSMVVTCTGCGKKLNVRDELVGKKLKCPGCGITFDAKSPSRSQVTSIHDMKRQPVEKRAGPRVFVSPTLIVGVSAAVLAVAALLIFIFGPVKAKRAWEAMGDRPRDDVQDVISRGLQAYLSGTGDWNPRKSGHTPVASGDETIFFWNLFVMSMPDTVSFRGSSTQGGFQGKYHPKTGEVEADVGIGGMSVAGLGAVREGKQKIHVTGRVKSGVVSAEVNGAKAEIHYPPAEE